VSTVLSSGSRSSSRRELAAEVPADLLPRFALHRYFSGTLEIFTVQGHGSDALLKIPKFGIESWASTERR